MFVFIVPQGAQDQSTENDDKPENKGNDESMEVDGNAQSNDNVTQNDDGNDKESAAVEQPAEQNSESVPVADSALPDANAESPAKNDIAPKEDAIETPKVETAPTPATDSPVTRPIEEAAIPAKEPAEVNEKANDCSHTNNESVDAVIKEKTEEKIDDAPSSK